MDEMDSVITSPDILYERVDRKKRDRYKGNMTAFEFYSKKKIQL